MPVEITGISQVVDFIERELPERLIGNFHSKIDSEKDTMLMGLRAAIQVHVYNQFQPDRYQRNFKLIQAANVSLSKTPVSVNFMLFNDTSRVSPTSPKGGSRPEDVPWEIEEGRWPTNWYGFVMPRPAYSLYSEVILPQIWVYALEAVDLALR